MACGDRYRYLIRTSAGLTIDAPFGTGLDAEIRGPADYLDWYKLVDDLVARAYKAFVRLGEAEQQRGSYPRWNALVDRNNAMIAAWDDLPYPFLQISPGTDVLKARDVALLAICVLDEANAGIEFYGGTIDGLPGPAGGGDGTVLVVIGVAAAAYFILKRSRDRKRAEQAAA